MHRNNVYICGPIVHIFDTQRGCALVTVKTGDHCFPVVVCHKEVAQKILQDYTVGMQVGFRGFLISSYTSKGTSQSVVAAEFIETMEEERVNFFRLEGKVLECQPYERFYIAKLLVEQDGHVACIPVSLRNENGVITPGTFVKVTGHVNTRVDLKKVPVRYYQDYYVDNLQAG